MLQEVCGALMACGVSSTPAYVEQPVTVYEPPPRYVVIRPKIIVRPQRTIVIRKPPVYVQEGCDTCDAPPPPPPPPYDP